MNLELIAIVLGTAFNLISLAVAATMLAFRMGNFEGRVDTKLDSIEDASQEMSVRLNRLDETNGGGFARCAQHTEQLRDMERRNDERMTEQNRQWVEVRERLERIET